jgi:hypothetical protein
MVRVGRRPRVSRPCLPPTAPIPVALRCGAPDNGAMPFAPANRGRRRAQLVIVRHLPRAARLPFTAVRPSVYRTRRLPIRLGQEQRTIERRCGRGGPSPPGWRSRIVLLGASQGASEALIAAMASLTGVTGVVALSADELTRPLADPRYPATAQAAAARLRVPAIFALAAGDRYVSMADTRALVASVPMADKQLIELPAGARAWLGPRTDRFIRSCGAVERDDCRLPRPAYVVRHV